VACLACRSFAGFLTQTFGFQWAVLVFGRWNGTVSAVFWVFVTGQSLCEPRILRHEHLNNSGEFTHPCKQCFDLLVFVQTTNCLNKDASSDLVYNGLQAAFTTVLPTVVEI
jgi:hypothetical protein